MDDPRERIHFVTGRLAEPSLRKILAALAPSVGFEYTIDVLNVTVAALLTTKLVARRMRVPEGTTRVVLPGLVSGPLEEVEAVAGVPVERGPSTCVSSISFLGSSLPPRPTTAASTLRSSPRSITPRGFHGRRFWLRPRGSLMTAPT